MSFRSDEDLNRELLESVWVELHNQVAAAQSGFDKERLKRKDSVVLPSTNAELEL